MFVYKPGRKAWFTHNGRQRVIAHRLVSFDAEDPYVCLACGRSYERYTDSVCQSCEVCVHNSCSSIVHDRVTCYACVLVD